MTEKHKQAAPKTTMGSKALGHVSKAVDAATSVLSHQASRAVSHVKEHGGEYASKAAHATGKAIGNVAKDAGNAVGHVAVRAGREAGTVAKMFNPLKDPNAKLKRSMTQGVQRAHDPDR